MNRRPGLLRRAVAVAAAAVAVVASLTWSAPGATAAVPQLVVEITGVEVTGSKPSDQVTVTGRVSNPEGAGVYGLTMVIWRSRDPIGDLPSLRQVTGGTPPPGVILSQWPEESYRVITGQSTAFAAGATAEFTVRARLADLGFDTAGRAYLVGARALGTSAGSTAVGKVGQGSTVVAVPGEPVPVTRLVMLTATPTKLTSGVFRNEDLAAELTGRLDALLTAAAAPGMSWLIDPALYDEVTDLADGYQVRDGDDLRPGTGQQVAKTWLQRFEKLDRRAGARTLFGTPDLTGAAAAEDPEVLTRARTATDQVTGLAGLPLLAWPTGGVYTEQADAYLSGDTPLLVTNPLNAGALQTASGGRTVLAAAVTLPASEDFAARQLALAETVLAGEAGQLRVLREPADLAADRAITAAWQAPRLLDALLNSDPRPGGYQEAAPVTLNPREFGKVADLEQSVTAYRQLVPDSAIPDEAAGLLTRAVSQAWIGRGRAHTALLREIDGLIGPTALKNAVTLDASPRFVMSARTSQFPLTVTNHLAESIRVKVQVDTDNSRRLRIPDTEVVTIPAGQSASITIRPEATANGVMIAEAWVATEDGTLVPPSIEITIEMTELGFVGWVIVLASGSVVLGATALRIWQVRRKATRDATPSNISPTDSEGLPSRREPGPGDRPPTVGEALDVLGETDGTTGPDGPDGRPESNGGHDG